MSYIVHDYYFKKAKVQNYVARSIFKLCEIDERFKLFRQGDTVLDLGAAPGSWSQYVSQKIGPQGQVLGIDLCAISLKISNATFLTGDLNEMNLDEVLKENNFGKFFDVVISDMAPKTTGVRVVDQTASLGLCELALDIAKEFLKPHGSLVCKLFHSADFQVFKRDVQKKFSKVNVFIPKSTRKESKEVFLIAQNKLDSNYNT
ncbi:MAG: RlmE family RNA methyltransferase [Deltaproteobacteria bacterium]|nr:RlmE family RNA methyltransferase [Deltaproteobacteria bacterium]